ncbi:GntR family transcriptional regulator, partial [Endobacter medicaginis]
MLSIGWERIFAGFRDTGEGTRQQRLREALVAAIEDGRLSAGTRLPSSRTLANLLRISRNTVVQALDQLVESGHLTARLRSGLFVAQRDMAEPAETAR